MIVFCPNASNKAAPFPFSLTLTLSLLTLLQIEVSEKQKGEKKNLSLWNYVKAETSSQIIKSEVPLYCADSGWTGVWGNKGRGGEGRSEWEQRKIGYRGKHERRRDGLKKDEEGRREKKEKSMLICFLLVIQIFSTDTLVPWNYADKGGKIKGDFKSQTTVCTGLHVKKKKKKNRESNCSLHFWLFLFICISNFYWSCQDKKKLCFCIFQRLSVL